MNKMIPLGAALISVITAAAASTAAVAADGPKHYGYGHYRGGYVAPAPVVRPYHGGGYRPGYWRNGRWIAPVVVGAAIGGLAIAASAPYYYSPPPVTYYAPPVATYVAPAAVSAFDAADYNRDGYVSFDEAARYPHWQRNFGFIDRNQDGYLSRDEVAGWRQY